jgi:hypothetical protein
MNVVRARENVCERLQQLRHTDSVCTSLQAEDLFLYTVGGLAKEIGDPNVGAKVREILQEYRRISRFYSHIGELSIADYQVACAISSRR